MDDKSTVRDYTKQVYAQIDASSLDVSAVSRLKTMIAIAENSKFLWVETKWWLIKGAFVFSLFIKHTYYETKQMPASGINIFDVQYQLFVCSERFTECFN